MLYIKRDIEEKITVLSEEYAALLLTGPRQVGETTVLKRLADASYQNRNRQWGRPSTKFTEAAVMRPLRSA